MYNSTNPTPNQAFVAGSVPSGGFFASIWRPTVAADNSVTWSQLIAAIRVMSFSPNKEALTVDRPDIDGGDNGWTMTAAKIEGSITLQLPNDATPTLQPGDAFVTRVIFRDSTGTPVPQMFVLGSMSINMDPNPRAMTGNARVNKQAISGGSGYNNLDAVTEYAPS